MKKLVFEKVGDIHSEYPYLCVYFSGEREPFMEISVTEERGIGFVIYANKSNVSLSVEDVKSILDRAIVFLPQALENEDSSQ